MLRRIPSVTSRLLKRINENTNNISNLESQVSNLQSQVSNIITDSFCVIGGSTIIGEDDEENPIYGTGKALGYTYDGITYYASPTPNILTHVRNIDFNGYQWIATGGSQNGTNSLVLSSDGINWITPFNNVLPYYISSIAWGKKKWVAIGLTNIEGGPLIAYSSDGMNWTLADYEPTVWLTSIASNGSKFIVTSFNFIASSTDGINWTETNVSSSLGTGVAIRGIVWGGNIWVAALSNVTSAIGYSTDGTTWHLANTSGIMNSGIGVAYNGTIFFAWGVGYSNCATSKDGIHWTGVTIPSNIANGGTGIKDVTWNGKYWVVVANTNDLIENKVTYSSDLVTWYISTTGNALYNQVQDMGGITSRNRKNYYLMLF